MARPASLAILVVLMAVIGRPGRAADRVILGKSLVVNDPHASEPGRSVIVVGLEKPTDVPALSDPTAGGATLTIIANGGSPSSQSYVLDGSGWSALGTTGFKYVGPTGADGDPVRVVVVKRTAGFARIKVVVRGNVGTQPVDVVPPNPGTDGRLILDVAGGDRYCVGSAAD